MKRKTLALILALFILISPAGCAMNGEGEKTVKIKDSDITYLTQDFCDDSTEDIEEFKSGRVIKSEDELTLFMKNYHADSEVLKKYDSEFFRNSRLAVCIRFASPLTEYTVTSAECREHTAHVKLKTVRSSKKTIQILSCGGFLMKVPKDTENIIIEDTEN